MNPRVRSVAALPEHRLLLTFDSGEQRQMSMQPYLAYGVFSPLLDPAFFALVRTDHGTVSWPGGIDVDPDSVYLDSEPVAQADPA